MHTKQMYINAARELLVTGIPVDTVVANLPVVLTQRGHAKLLHSVLVGLCLDLEQEEHVGAPRIIVADKNNIPTEQVAQLLRALSAPSDSYVLEENKNIIGGAIATYNSKQIDASYQTKLRELYQSIITA